MLNIFRKTEPQRPINPRFRAYGKARIDIAQRAATRDDWDRLWKRTTFTFPFTWGDNWKQCIEYKVADFPAEVGFYIDILGFPVNAFDPDYAMFTSPAGEFFFSVVPVMDGEDATPPDAIRLQFMVNDIKDTADELERRGVVFDQWPVQSGEGSALFIASFRSPHGIGIDLWGFSDEDLSMDAEVQQSFEDLSEDIQDELQFEGDELEDQHRGFEEKFDPPEEHLPARTMEPDPEQLFDLEYLDEE